MRLSIFSKKTATFIGGLPLNAIRHTHSYQNSVIEALKNAYLAVDPRVTGKFDVETVTMFGPPDTWSSANPDARYVSIENDRDIVPKIDEILEGRLTRDDLKKN